MVNYQASSSSHINDNVNIDIIVFRGSESDKIFTSEGALECESEIIISEKQGTMTGSSARETHRSILCGGGS